MPYDPYARFADEELKLAADRALENARNAPSSIENGSFAWANSSREYQDIMREIKRRKGEVL